LIIKTPPTYVGGVFWWLGAWELALRIFKILFPILFVKPFLMRAPVKGFEPFRHGVPTPDEHRATGTLYTPFDIFGGLSRVVALDDGF
jgi:hypothetical protein